MIAALLLAVAQPSSSADGIMIFGLGLTSCGSWTAAKTEGWHRDAYISWLAGFLSGINAAGVGRYGNAVQGTDMNGLIGWVDNYCAAHPLDNVSAAAENLGVVFLKRDKSH